MPVKGGFDSKRELAYNTQHATRIEGAKRMGKTFVEKILALKAGLEETVPGQIVTVQPDKLLTHDNTSAIAKNFRKIGVDRVANPDMNVTILDHVVPAANETYAQSHKETREFVREQGISAFYDIGEGICHQVLPEQGHALPGTLIVGSDSHTPTHGAFGAFAAGIGRTEAAAVMRGARRGMRSRPTAMSAPAASSQARVKGEKKAHAWEASVRYSDRPKEAIPRTRMNQPTKRGERMRVAASRMSGQTR